MAFVVCIAVLAVLAQANAYVIKCGCEDQQQTVQLSGCESAVLPVSQVYQGELAFDASAEFSGAQSAAQNTERVDRNTYQINLDHTGPRAVRMPSIIRTRAQAPAVQKPTITLPARIPGPRTICNQCKCVKTIVKPQVYEQLITVPVIQRYIQTTHRPVVEKIHYQAVPANGQDTIEAYSDNSEGVQGAVVAVEGQYTSALPVELSSDEGYQVESDSNSCSQCVEQVVPVQAISYHQSC